MILILLWLGEKTELVQSEIPNKRGWNKQVVENCYICQVKTYSHIYVVYIHSSLYWDDMARWKGQNKIPRGKVEVSRIWTIVIFVSELSAWLMLGLSNIDEKSERAEAIARFVCIQIVLMWVKEKIWMYLCLICGLLLYDSVGILTEFV